MAATNTSSGNASFAHLPRRKWWGVHNLYQWDGFWYHLSHLEGMIAAQNHFKARDDDVILASSIKTGTTWLKALIPCIMARRSSAENGGNAIGVDNLEDPLITNHPNSLIPSLEIEIYRENPRTNLSWMRSPRLFRTHMPYRSLPESAKSSRCQIVYISRNPKDTFVSMWHFVNTTRSAEEGPFPIEEAFESFCGGVHPYGPSLDHELEYWKESLERPNKILFLKYEEMKKDPKGQVMRLAEFLGCPFAEEEEVEKVLWRCSLERLKSLEVNKEGIDPWIGLAKSSYFRLGVVGDWKNHLTDEMAERLDEITSLKLEGTGLNFDM